MAIISDKKYEVILKKLTKLRIQNQLNQDETYLFLFEFLIIDLLLFHTFLKIIGIVKVIIIQIVVTTLSTAIVPAYNTPFFENHILMQLH